MSFDPTDPFITIGTAIISAALTQLLNLWKLWPRMAAVEARLKAIEDKLDDIGHFSVNRSSGPVGH
jgi:hypothetical protein